MSPDDDVIELTEDGVFEIPSPKRSAATTVSTAEVEDEYPGSVPSTSSGVALDDVAEGEYKVYRDDAGKQLHVILHLVAPDEAKTVECKKGQKASDEIVITTTSGLSIPIDVSALAANLRPDLSKCTAQRYQQFLVLVLPLVA